MSESLFREGKELLEQRRFDEACPKFEESARLDPASGVELALGLCREGQGRLASAWAAYLSAASLARRDGRVDREEAAKSRAAAVEPKVSHVTLDVAPETAVLIGLVVKQDGIVIGSAAWHNTPLDPGAHTLEVSAPGKRAFSQVFSLGPVGDQVSVRIPVLEDIPGPAPPPPVAAPPRPESRHTEAKAAGFVIGGAGIVTLGVAGVLGIVTLNDASAVHAVCQTTPCPSRPSVALQSENQTAGTLGDFSTALFVGGGVALAAGVLLVLASGRHDEEAKPAARLQPVIGPGYAGLGGRW